MHNITQEQLNKFFELAGMLVPEQVQSTDITKALIELENKLLVSTGSKSALASDHTPNILVVDDLELSIHQLTLLLNRSGFNLEVARSFDEAVQHFQKQKFDYVLVDLFLPEPEIGFDLIEKLKNSSRTVEFNTKIVVISGTDDKSLVSKCFLKGADEFIEKSTQWHKNVLKFIKKIEAQKSTKTSGITVNVEDENKKIVLLGIKNINSKSIAAELENEIISQANSGFSNVIIDMKNITSLDSKHTATLISGYKACIENQGALKLCNVSKAVSDALSFVFLNNIISSYKDKQTAMESFKN